MVVESEHNSFFLNESHTMHKSFFFIHRKSVLLTYFPGKNIPSMFIIIFYKYIAVTIWNEFKSTADTANVYYISVFISAFLQSLQVHVMRSLF